MFYFGCYPLNLVHPLFMLCHYVYNVLGNNLTPSVVSVDENNEIIVGEIAKERLITHPDRTIENFKRYMGTEKKFKLGPYEFLPEELSSENV